MVYGFKKFGDAQQNKHLTSILTQIKPTLFVFSFFFCQQLAVKLIPESRYRAGDGNGQKAAATASTSTTTTTR